MTADPTVLDRIFDRLIRTLSVGSPDQLSAPFSVSELVQALVPYRTYRSELRVDTLQDYEHAVLELLAGERGLLVCDAETVAVIRQELASPDPDTGLLHRLGTVQVRLGAVRMPITMDIRQPIAYPDDDARQSASLAQMLMADLEPARAPEPTPMRDAPPDAESTSPAAPATAAPATAAPATAAPATAAPATAAPATAAPATAEQVTTLASVASPVGSHEDVDRAVNEALTPVSVRALGALAVPATPAAPLPSVADLAEFVPPVEPPPATPLHAIKSVTMANPATLSRITPLSVTSIYGDPIEFRGIRHAPVDIGGVIFLFGMVARELGFNVEAMSSGFPRCEAKRQLAPGKWARVRIDFELESRHFREAGRNPSSCDLIVCWRDTWPDRPSGLDVLALHRVLPTLPSRE